MIQLGRVLGGVGWCHTNYLYPARCGWINNPRSNAKGEGSAKSKLTAINKPEAEKQQQLNYVIYDRVLESPHPSPI